ncbi:MAG: TetR/AcrR family transcriptional regulator [Pseudomonadota bacterium]
MTKQLTKTDWLEFGLRTLLVEGPTALKADTLAKKLKVSRGSFYWHFRNLADFKTAVLALWRDRSTTQIIADLSIDDNAPALATLITRAFESRDKTEGAIRAWAQQDGTVAQTVAEVDGLRLSYIARLLQAEGIPKTQIATRARLLYWAYLGQQVYHETQQSAEDMPDVGHILDVILADT